MMMINDNDEMITIMIVMTMMVATAAASRDVHSNSKSNGIIPLDSEALEPMVPRNLTVGSASAGVGVVGP